MTVRGTRRDAIGEGDQSADFAFTLRCSIIWARSRNATSPRIRARASSSSLEQAKRYSHGFTPDADQSLPGGQCGDFPDAVPVRHQPPPFLRQLKDRSGMLFFDARTPTVPSSALKGWYTPDGLTAILKQDHARAHAQFETEPTEYLGLRDHQLAAIRTVEEVPTGPDSLDTSSPSPTSSTCPASSAAPSSSPTNRARVDQQLLDLLLDRNHT